MADHERSKPRMSKFTALCNVENLNVIKSDYSPFTTAHFAADSIVVVFNFINTSYTVVNSRELTTG